MLSRPTVTASSTTLLGFSKSSTVGANGESKLMPNVRAPPVRSYINGTLLSLLVPSKGAFGLIKFNVVLRFGLVVSDEDVEISTLANRCSPCHSPPKRNISLLVNKW